jgi:hypothetical protein
VDRAAEQRDFDVANEVERKARGLDAALVDKALIRITLDLADNRSFVVAVAGQPALLIAKLHNVPNGSRTEPTAPG